MWNYKEISLISEKIDIFNYILASHTNSLTLGHRNIKAHVQKILDKYYVVLLDFLLGLLNILQNVSSMQF